MVIECLVSAMEIQPLLSVLNNCWTLDHAREGSQLRRFRNAIIRRNAFKIGRSTKPSINETHEGLQGTI